MVEDSDPSQTEHEARIDSALAESQRLEREELDADLAKQHSADERIVRALVTDPSENPEQ